MGVIVSCEVHCLSFVKSCLDLLHQKGTGTSAKYSNLVQPSCVKGSHDKDMCKEGRNVCKGGGGGVRKEGVEQGKRGREGEEEQEAS